jgi:hypothetical protein
LFWAARASDRARSGPRGPALKFSPVNARSARWTPAPQSLAGNGSGAQASAAQVTPPAQADNNAARAPLPATQGTPNASVAPPITAPAIVGEFAFRIEPSFREQLDAVMAQANATHLQFPVADGRMVDLAITRHEAGDATQGVLYGRVDDQPLSQVVLAYVDDAVAGSIVTPDGEMFLVRYAGGGVHRTYQIDPERIPSEGEPMMPSFAADQRPDLTGSAPEPIVAPLMAADAPPVAEDATDMQVRDGSNSVVDVMVVYTTQSRINNGGVSGMNALINAATAKANLAYTNSQAPVLVRIAHTAEVSYAASGSLGTDLGALQNGSDGKMDEIYALRTTYNADMVSLFVPTGDAAGIAYLINPESSGAGALNWVMSVVVDVYADGNITFAHELGHNMGAGHGLGNGGGVFSFAGGYRFFTSNQWYRTVMAYAPGIRLPYFSNPNVGYLGSPTGQATTAYNALTLTRTRRALAALQYGVPDSTVSVQADLNADNKPDLLMRNTFTSAVSAWLMDGATRTSSSTIWPASTAADAAWIPMTSADFNADGKPDILWRNSTTGRVIVWYMDGVNRTGTAVIWAVTTASDAQWMPMATGDFNADSKPDIVWRNMTTGRVIVWYMDGVTRTGTAALWSPATTVEAQWVPMASGDFNADGKPDLIWRHLQTGRVIIWFIDGVTRTGTFTLWQGNVPAEFAWRPMAASDFNADGQIDIVWRNTDTGRVIVWYMNGTTRVSTAVIAS